MAFNITDFNNKWGNFKEELKNYINRSIDKNGDTMIGSLLLSSAPQENMEVTNKEYVDNYVGEMIGFRPGNTLLLNKNLSCNIPGGYSSSYESYWDFEASSYKNKSTTDVYSFTPSASGGLRLKANIKLSTRNGDTKVPVFSQGSSSYSMTELYDIKMKGELYYYEPGGSTPIYLWQDDSISIYKEFKGTGTGLRDELVIDRVVPVECGKMTTVGLSISVLDYAYPNDSSYSGRKLYYPPVFNATIRLGTSNPIYSLSYQEV